MKGLIIKDFINLKKNLKIMGVLTIFYAFMSLSMEDSSFFSSIFTMLFAILVLSLYSYDEMAKWDAYALTMPISKDSVVQAKYLMMLLLTFIGATFSALFSAVLNVTVYSTELLNNVESIGVGAAIVILFYSITFPFITKLGIEKARLIFFAVYLVPFVLIVMLSKVVKAGEITIPENMITLFHNVIEYAHILLPVTVLVALGISYMISVNIYRKKEF